MNCQPRHFHRSAIFRGQGGKMRFQHSLCYLNLTNNNLLVYLLTTLKRMANENGGREIRALRSESELLNWAEHCCACFSSKPRPPSAEYFINHFKNDPWRDLKTIFVLIDIQTNKILSTLRVFTRYIYSVSGCPLKMAGIGEVCTAPNFRRLGFSKLLLSHAIQVITEEKYDGAFLHAAPWIRILYKSFGFESYITPWARISSWPISVNLSDNLKYISKFIATSSDVHNLTTISNNFNRNFSGPVIRDDPYTSHWIESESKGYLIAVFQVDLTSSSTSNSPIAYGFFKDHPDGYTVLADFGCNTNECSILKQVLSSIVQFKLSTYNAIDKDTHESQSSTELRIPMALYDLISKESELESLPLTGAYIDDGWMFLTINTDKQLPLSQDNNVFWPIDNF